MGGTISKDRPRELPFGCFWGMNLNRGAFEGVFLLPTFGRNYDCDCRLTGYCPGGPPPLPPLEQFMDRNTSTEIYADCDLTDEFPPYGRKPNGWDVNRGWHDEAASWDPYRPDYLKDVQEEEQRQQEIEDKKSGGKRQVAAADSFGESTIKAIVTAFKNLPRPTRAVLRRQFEHLFRVDETAVNSAGIQSSNNKLGLPSSVAGDLGFVVGLVLTEPDQPARRVVSTFPLETVEFLLRCSDYAIHYGLQSIQQLSSSQSRSIERSESVSGESDNSNYTIAAEVEAIYHFAGRYLAGMPNALWEWEQTTTDQQGERSGFPNLTKRYPSSYPMDLTCTTIHGAALENVALDRRNRFVASYPEAMMALSRQSLSPLSHGVLNSLRTEEHNWDNFNLTEANMQEKLGGAFTAVVVAINFMTLSLHASSRLLNAM